MGHAYTRTSTHACMHFYTTLNGTYNTHVCTHKHARNACMHVYIHDTKHITRVLRNKKARLLRYTKARLLFKSGLSSLYAMSLSSSFALCTQEHTYMYMYNYICIHLYVICNTHTIYIHVHVYCIILQVNEKFFKL